MMAVLFDIEWKENLVVEDEFSIVTVTSNSNGGTFFTVEELV